MSTSEPQEREMSEGEELVAYLDGELPPDVNRRVEERLSADADYRQQLRELDQAWEALDSLPRTAADDDFARTTIEMVAVAAQRDLSQREEEVAHSNRWQGLRWVAAAVAVAVASFVVASALIRDRDQELLADLPVIRQIDMLREISDIEFLRELAKHVSVRQLIQNDETHARELKAIELASAPLAEREKWVRSLSQEDQQNLWAQQDRYFNDGTDQERQRLRNLQAQIAAAPDRNELQAVLVAYWQWLMYRRANTQIELRDPSVPAADRVARIAEMVGQGRRQLTTEEREQLRAEIGRIAADYKDEFREFVEDSLRDEQNRSDSRNSDRLQASANLLKLIDGPDDPKVGLLTVEWALWNNDTDDDVRQRLEKQLNPDTIKFLTESRESGLRGRGGRPSGLLGDWTRESLPQTTRRSYRTDALREYFRKSLTPEERRALIEEPTAEFENAVARMLEEEEFGFEELRLLMGRGRGGGRGRRGGEPGGRGRGNDGRGEQSRQDRRGGPPGPDGERRER